MKKAKSKFLFISSTSLVCFFALIFTLSSCANARNNINRQQVYSINSFRDEIVAIRSEFERVDNADGSGSNGTKWSQSPDFDIVWNSATKLTSSELREGNITVENWNFDIDPIPNEYGYLPLSQSDLGYLKIYDRNNNLLLIGEKIQVIGQTWKRTLTYLVDRTAFREIPWIKKLANTGHDPYGVSDQPLIYDNQIRYWAK